MEIKNGVKGNICEDVFFTESGIPGVTPIKHVHIEISRQNSNLTEVKERMAREVKTLGANAIMNFKYGQKKHSTWQLVALKWDTSGNALPTTIKIGYNGHVDSHKEVRMIRQFSVAEARNRLTELIHRAEDDGPVRITRRGKPVVVLVSERDYVKISGDASGFSEAAEAFRLSLAPEDLDGIGDALKGLRGKEQGRKVTL
jgi:prevent-host-death family protein